MIDFVVFGIACVMLGIIVSFFALPILYAIREYRAEKLAEAEMRYTHRNEEAK